MVYDTLWVGFNILLWILIIAFVVYKIKGKHK